MYKIWRGITTVNMITSFILVVVITCIKNECGETFVIQKKFYTGSIYN